MLKTVMSNFLFMLVINQKVYIILYAFAGVNVAETVKALTELKHTPASPNSVRRMSASSQSIFQAHVASTQQTTCLSPQSPMLSSFQSHGQKLSYLSQSGGIIYAQPSQIISGSPSAVRRVSSFRSQSADRKSGDGKYSLYLAGYGETNK